MIHKLTSIFLSLLLIIGIFNFPVFATNENSSDSSTTSSSSSSEESKPEPPKGDFTVQVDTVEANAGDAVIVILRIINNPGVMAMTISITYDSSALDYQYYYYGNVFSDYTVKEHPSRNIIRLVISQKSDIYNDGYIVGFRFNIAKDAEAKLHEMTVEYSSGDFCNNDLVRLMPKIIPGGVDVAYNGTNCGHRKYSDWTETIAPTCTTEGAEQRTCAKCGHNELRNTDPAGHDYEDKWTVDIPATKDSAGTMSRHCKNCESTTDETNFTLQNSEDGNIQNEANGSVPDNDITNGIIGEQHPDLNKDEPVSSEKPTSSDETTSADKDSNENSSNVLDPQDNSEDISDESINEQIKDIIEIISPDKTDEEKGEIAISINQKLREVFPKFDTITKAFRISFIMMIIFIIF